MRSVLLSAALGLLFLSTSWGQAAQPTAGESPAQVAEDVELLLTVARLALTQEQIEELVPHLRRAQQVKAAFAQERAEAMQGLEEHLDDVIDSLAHGRAPVPARDQAVGRRLADLETERLEHERALHEVASDVAVTVLTPDQAALIESPEAEADRLYCLRVWRGATTALDFVMNSLRAARDLMPDEYVSLRPRIADQTAAGLLDPADPAFSAVRRDVLALFDELHPVPAQQFQGEQPQITQHVAQVLQITPEMRVPEEGEIISYSVFISLLHNPRTFELFANEDAAPTPPDDLQPRLNALDALWMAHLLQLDAGQLRELATVGEAIQEIWAEREQVEEQAAQAVIETLQEAREAMLAGEELDEQAQADLQAFQERTHTEDASAQQRQWAEVVNALDALYLKQQELIEVPPDLAAPPMLEGPDFAPQALGYSELKERLVALLFEARSVNPIEFAAARPEAVPGVLEGIVPPGTREYYRARWRIRKLIGRASLVPDEEFPLAVDELADDFLAEHGIVPEWAALGLRPMTFEEFERVVTLPEAPQQWERLAENLPRTWRGGP